MEALKAIKIIGNQNDGMDYGCVFISSKYWVTKDFKFHARPQTGAYSCLNLGFPNLYDLRMTGIPSCLPK